MVGWSWPIGKLKGRTAYNTGWMLTGYASKIGLQGGAFLILARALGPSGYGTFVAALAAVNLVSPLADFGAYSLIVQDITGGVETRRAVGSSIGIGLLAAPGALLVLLVGQRYVLHQVPVHVLILLALAVFFGARLTLVARAACVGHGAMWRNAIIEMLNGVCILAASLAVLVYGGGVESWVRLYLAVATLVGLVSILWVSRTWGLPAFRGGGVKSRFRLGIHYSIGLAAQTAYTDLDKAMLGELGSTAEAGVFGVAYRATSLAILPLMALEGALYPDFFRRGKSGYKEARKLAVRVMPLSIIYGASIGAAIWFLAPLAPRILGPAYSDVTVALRILMLLVVIQALTYPFADALTGSGHQGMRSAGQVCALAVSFALNLKVIPLFGWKGAAWASVTTQALLMMFLIWYPVIARSSRTPVSAPPVG